ncbi:MAG TPA: hypothetical protein VMT00_09135 [Thermoanaerobaculia bacterium]|nr:hypothetical protein [Thermoanaerobaculia bacterium]
MTYRAIIDRVAITLLVLASFACQQAEIAAPERAATTPLVVEVRTTDYAFHAPGELPSGWTTLSMTNEGNEPHFLVLWLLPEGKSYDDFVKEVYDPFIDLFGRYKSGDLGRDEMLAQLGGVLPEWLNLAEMGRGGPGFVSPGRTAVTTVDLAPGNYVMECYMVNAEGQPHNKLGMLRPLTVTAASTGARPPEAGVELALSNSGISVSGKLGPGTNTVKVTVTEAPEGFLGHDVHLARLDDDTPIEKVIAWMDWVDGLDPPSPAEFRGGAEQVPAGYTSYVTVDLDPGRYVWISEAYGRQGVVEEFRVE